MNLSEYNGVWVYAEQRQGVLQKVALELLGKGKGLAQELGCPLTAVLFGDQVEKLGEELLAYGADQVIYVEDKALSHYSTEAYTQALCQLTLERKPNIILMGATFLGRDLGPRVSARLATGLTADCTDLHIQEETSNLLMTRPAFGGNLMATIVCTEHRPQMATVRPGVFTKAAKNHESIDLSKVEKVSMDFSQLKDKVRFVEAVKELKQTVDITEVEFIVSGGRGVGSKENFKILQELADALGGTVAGSRAAVEAGWVPPANQVGQTGKTVRPIIYVACGISGSIQHLAGMQESEYIIAINKDDEAPIMKVADLGLVGDLNHIIPELKEQLLLAKAN